MATPEQQHYPDSIWNDEMPWGEGGPVAEAPELSMPFIPQQREMEEESQSRLDPDWG